MENKIYCIINANNVVDNVVLWNGNPAIWKPLAGCTYVLQDTTPSRIWKWNKDQNDWVLVDTLGHGSIGFIWDGAVLTTASSKPPTINLLQS